MQGVALADVFHAEIVGNECEEDEMPHVEP